MTKAKPVAATARRCGGIFQTDPALPHPADLRGRRVCLCGLIGEPGDAHHTLPVVPEQAAHRQRYGGKED